MVAAVRAQAAARPSGVLGDDGGAAGELERVEAEEGEPAEGVGEAVEADGGEHQRDEGGGGRG